MITTIFTDVYSNYGGCCGFYLLCISKLGLGCFHFFSRPGSSYVLSSISGMPFSQPPGDFSNICSMIALCLWALSLFPGERVLAASAFPGTASFPGSLGNVSYKCFHLGSCGLVSLPSATVPADAGSDTPFHLHLCQTGPLPR